MTFGRRILSLHVCFAVAALLITGPSSAQSGQPEVKPGTRMVTDPAEVAAVLAKCGIAQKTSSSEAAPRSAPADGTQSEGARTGTMRCNVSGPSKASDREGSVASWQTCCAHGLSRLHP